MSANAQDFDFEYDKPGAERSRRRRGEDDTIESDLDEELLDEDWLSGKKNLSDASDEELNDALLQSDDEEMNMSGQNVSLNATYNLGTSYNKRDDLREMDYEDNVMNQGAEDCEEGYLEEEGYEREGEDAYTQFNQEDNTEMPEDQINYTGRLSEDDDGYPDEVLDLGIDPIDDPIDGDFQDEEYPTFRGDGTLEDGTTQEEDSRAVGGEEQQDQEFATEEPVDTEEVENEPLFNDDSKEESNEEEEDDEASGRMRFKSERKDSPVVRLAAPSSKRRSIPDTLELSEEAKKDLMEFEEQERQRRQIRHGGRGRGGGGRGGRGRGGFHGFGIPDFRGKRGRIHDQMPRLMGNLGIQPSSRMAPPPPPPHHHHQQVQHHPSRPRGPSPFPEHGRPIPQQPLQPLIPHHMAHRSPPLRPQMEPPPRMMSSPPPNFPQQQHHQQQQPPQPKNIHINPHFRGPTQPSVQVPLMPPAQSQTRPAAGPQRFPGPGDFQQRMPGNFGQPQRPPHHMEPLRNQPPQGPQDREPLFIGDPPRFPGQHMFDHQGPGSLMNSSNNLHQLAGQGHVGFGPPGPPFTQPGQGPIGLFQREPPRPNLPPHPGHQGMVNFNQQGGPPNQPRPFMSPRQSFGQQGNLFTHPQVPFGMQVRLRLPHHEPLSPHPMHQQQQHHRQELPHHHQQQMNHGEPRSIMHHGQNPFSQQQAHGSPRQIAPRPQNPQQRNMTNRHRMNTPISKPMQPRNSNLRELPVAPCNPNTNSGRPILVPASPTGNVKPVSRTTQGMRLVQNPPPTPGGGRGRGQVAARSESQFGEAGRMVASKEIKATTQDPDEDEETRQYRLKIEEQKRLREEILKRKEMRRQMQAGVRKKELLERLNAQTSMPTQGPASVQTQPAQPNQQHPQHPVQQLEQPPAPAAAPAPQQLEQKRQQRPQGQQQRPFPQRAPQSLTQTVKTPNQGNTIQPSSAAQAPMPRPNVKTRLQMVKGSAQQLQTPGPGAGPVQPIPNQQQTLQQRNNTMQGVSSQVHSVQAAEKNIPTSPPVNLAKSEGPRPGAKRTVMERAKSAGGEVPQKVRVVKLSGLSGKGPEATSTPVQQQGTWQAAPLSQGVQRKVTMTGQQQQGPGGAPQASLGGMADAQQSRVVVSGRGRGRGGGQMGRGRPVAARLSQRAAENLCCTVSIEGLSSSTTEFQLKSLLKSIGPIEMFKMMPQQRKAVAKFSSPQHAASFQLSFHRHMIDLSHIDVSLIDG